VATTTQPTRPSAAARIRRRRVVLGIATLAVALALYVAIGFALAWASMQPKRRAPTESPKDYGLAFEPISFRSADGVDLRGWYVPAGRARPRGVVIMCHGIDGTRQQMLGNARTLHRIGCASVLFDFRARGESGGSMCTLGYREPDDVLAAIAWAKARPELRGAPVGLLGASLGGATAIMAAARSPHVRAVCVEAPFSQLDRAVDCNFRRLAGGAGPLLAFPTRQAGQLILGRSGADISPVREIGRIAPRPVFIIADQEDDLFPAIETQALYRAAGEPKQIWTVPGAGHCGAGYMQPDEYKRRVTRFFLDNLK